MEMAFSSRENIYSLIRLEPIDFVLQNFENKGTTIYTIQAQDQLIDATRNLGIKTWTL